MSKVEIIELGRKWYGVAVYFNDDEIDRISPDILRGLGGKLRYDTDGGLRALFHFNVTNRQNSAQLLQILTYFGKDGYFQNGMNITASSAEDIIESNTAIGIFQDKIKSSCLEWSKQWQEIAVNAITKKLTRIQLLRQISNLGLSHVTEKKLRNYIEAVLRKKYTSDLFVETFMWRLGWPDKRKPQHSVHKKLPLRSKLTSAS